MTALRYATASIAALLLSGCFKSYVAVSFRGPEEGSAAAGETLVAPALAQARPAIRRVAVRAPYGCLASAPARRDGTGVAEKARSVLDVRCPAWLDALEGALARHYEVVPWKTFAEAERAAGSARVAAQRIGAEAVLLVHELDSTPVLVGEADPGALVLTRARPSGELRGPAKLSEDEQWAIRSLVQDRFRDGALVGVRLTVDATALLAATGETVFAYRRTLGRDLGEVVQARMLVRGRSDTWRPVAPRGAGKPVGKTATAAETLQQEIRTAATRAADDLVLRFTTGS